jgi:large subunit ribosomal protein L22
MGRSLKKGPFIDLHLLEKVEGMNRRTTRRSSRPGRAARPCCPRWWAHDRGAQREEVHPGVCDRKHGGAQAGRVRPDADVQGPHHESRQGSVGSGQGRQLMVQAQATAKYRAHVGAEGRIGAGSDSRQGRQAGALATLRFSRKMIAQATIEKVLKSAIANAQQADGFGGDVDRLFVNQCFADQGPSMKRVRPAPMGRAFRVQKRTAHLTVGVPRTAGQAVGVTSTGPDGFSASAPAKRRSANRRLRRRRRPAPGARSNSWVRRFIRTDSASASTRPGGRAGSPTRTTRSCCTKT